LGKKKKKGKKIKVGRGKCKLISRFVKTRDAGKGSVGVDQGKDNWGKLGGRLGSIAANKA